MDDHKQGPHDEKMEQFLGNLLRAGVVLAATVVLAGGLLYLVRHGGEQPDYRVFRGEPADLRSPSGIVVDAGKLKSRGLIQLGLLLLIATPVARVFLSAVGFARQRDWIYVGLTLVVLLALIFSPFLDPAAPGGN
jgi:uncharacterized membrane protein